MSDSPIRRFTSASPIDHLKREENLINAYEAEEERIINVLSRKLEQVRRRRRPFPSSSHALVCADADPPHSIAPRRKDSTREYARGRERVAGE